MTLSNIAGVMATADQDRFARTLFRATRGNTFTEFQQIPEALIDEEGKPSYRAIFVVYFQGGLTSAMSDKIKRICLAYGVRTYPWPGSVDTAFRRQGELESVIQDKQRVLD